MPCKLRRGPWRAAPLLCCLVIGGCHRNDASGEQAADKIATPSISSDSPRSPFDSAVAALQANDLSSAERYIEAHLVTHPQDPAGLERAGDIAAASSRPLDAIELYKAAVEHSSAAPASLYEKLGRQWLNSGSPYEAAEVLRRSAAKHSDNAKVRADLAGLLASLGMVRDAAVHLRWLLRRGKGGLNELIMLADLNVPQTDRAICEYSLRRKPEDLRPKYPLALESAYEQDFRKAADELAKVTARHRDFSAAWALYGRLLVELGEAEKLAQWRRQHPAGVDRWPDYWMAAGTWAEQQHEPELAASAFWKVLKIDDCHGEALVQLAAQLKQLGRDEEAGRVALRAADVNAMHNHVESLLAWRGNSQQAALATAEAMSRLGRPWEAEAWARASLAMTQELDDGARQAHRRLHAKLTSTTPWQLPESSVVNTVDLSDLAEFRWSRESESSPTIATDSTALRIRFADEAAERGLIHTTSISKTSPEASLWIYQSNAGGAGVIDYDLDGWPDLYLTVIDGQPMKMDSGTNRLFRNEGGRFSDWTGAATADDHGFSQGVAVGDYNQDGFPDLLVANIGANHCLRNNGDGTFQDVTEEIGLEGLRWTTSLAIADFDSDGIADFFEVNYAAGESPYAQDCVDSNLNEPRSCSPLVFPAEPDRLWRGVGDGTFADRSEAWLADQVAGHGLGLVVGQIDEAPGLDVYVANDMTANQFWSATRIKKDPEDESGSERAFVLNEQAAIRGLAVNRRSKSQASMGIAVGDADSDGDLDIFLTHFTDDYNTLYEQIKPGAWFDRTASVGMAQPSMKTLAFGTEWIDADNNGSLELLVANGNVDDFSHQGHPLRMRPQVFVRSANGVWSESNGAEIGPYFERRVIGRALATVDVNRDGLQDAVITHLFDPVAVLVNQSPTESRSIRLFLKGRRSSRDAVGAIIRATVNTAPRSMYLTAGDGFQCSNERCVMMGLGSANSAEAVSIQWPDGELQAIGELRGGHNYLIVQGDPDAFLLD